MFIFLYAFSSLANIKETFVFDKVIFKTWFKNKKVLIKNRYQLHFVEYDAFCLQIQKFRY